MAVKFLNGINVQGSLNLHSDDIPDLNARKITAGALDGARLPWNDNDGFSGTYPIVWTATDGLYRSTWLKVRGSDDTLLTRNITADGNVIANNLNIANWDVAYGWGDHGSEGYLTGITSSQVTTALGYTPYEEGTTLSVGTGEINGTNFNIKGVNQIEINDPGEGIVWTSGSSGNITLATVDDTSDNILNLTGTNASFAINGATVATQTYADNAAGAVNTALSEEIGNLSTAVSANTTEAANNRTAITNLGTSKQDAGNYFTDGDTVLNMANNDGLVYNDTTNRMYVKLDGTNREIYHEGNFTPSNYLSLSGGTATGTIAAPTFDATTEVTVGPWAIRHNSDNGRLEFVLS